MILMIILLIVSSFLDGILQVIFKDVLPLFFLATIVVFSIKNNNKLFFYFFIFLFGLIYGLSYTSLFFLYAFIYVFIAYILSFISNKNNYIKLFFTYNLSILMYIVLMFIFSFYTNYNLMNIIYLYFKNLPLNYIYFTIMYLFINTLCNNRNRLNKYS